MKRKIQILLGVGLKAIRKLARGDISYKQKNVGTYFMYIIRYGRQNGLTPLINRIKKELLIIDARYDNGLYFPNGLVSVVPPHVITDWYKKNWRPVTIVIPSYNDIDILKPCLKSIKETTEPDRVKIIVVDDYCQPSSQKALKRLEDDQVSVIYRSQNGGFGKAVNTGLRAANPKDDVVLLNSDIVAHDGWLEALQYGGYEFGADTGIIGPKLLYPDGRIQSAGSHRNTDVPEFFDHYYRFQESNYGPANVPQYCIGVTGACMYVKQEFLKYVGFLDEDFQFAFEDMDWCIRGWEAGFRSLYFPMSTLTHVESATRSKNKIISAKEKQSVEYFWQKWGDWFDNRNLIAPDGRKRIIFVLQSFGLSGGIKNIFEQANRLSERDFLIEIWGLDSKPTPWEVYENVKIRTFKNYDRLVTALTPIEAIKVATWWETAFPVWLASVNKGIPVYFIQEFESWFYPDDLLAQATVISCYRKEFRNVTISSYNKDELRAIGLDATLLPCGYDDLTYRSLPRTKRREDVLLSVGRNFFQKNFKMTFDGWKLLGDSRPLMWLFGHEPEMQKMDNKITYYNRPTNKEVNVLYNEATVFVQTSRHEGFCLPILEAMAAGCPVICTDAHGNRDFCFDGKNCLMVEQEDSVGLKEAIEKLFNDPTLGDRLSKQGIKTAKKYQWESIMKLSEQFFRQVK